MISITVTNDNLAITFQHCRFNSLECNSQKGGGIGLYFHYNKKNMKLFFEDTTFVNIFHSHNTIGGSAIAISENFENKLTDLDIKNCAFSNISDTNEGGAIYFNSNKKSINIKNCTFDHSGSSKDGNSIYIAQSNGNLITISECHFIDCGTSPTNYVININCQKFDFLDNEIVFTDISKSCGCIKSNQCNEHKYERNIFRNACVEFTDHSAGIDESNPSNSNKIVTTENTFDGISGPREGRCFYVNLAQTYINVDNNTIQNCPSGGILIKFDFQSQFSSFQFSKYRFINNLVDESSLSSLNICPQIFIKTPIGNDYSNQMDLTFENCYFENNYNPKKGGALSYGLNQYNANSKTLFSNCQFIGNKAEEGGSALSLHVYHSCIISNCEFIRNKSDVGRRAIFIETDFECPSVASKPSVTPTIDISTCTFENNEGKNAGIVVGNSQNAPFSIKNCPFINCGNAGHVINVESNVQSTKIHDCSINYDSNTFSGGISIHSNGKIEISYISFISTSVDSALSIESEEETKLVSVMQCLFDSCTVNSQSCFYIYTQTSSFVFKDITVKNTKLTGCDNYLGRFILNGHYTLTMTNVSFNNIACSSLFGGGTGMAFSGISELVFDKCDFVNNEAHQDRSESRPIAIKDADQTPYYNGDGGAIQIGCQTETAGMIVRFKNCNFNNNKAARHGGALAIQTIKEIELFECKIERNNANFDFESSSNLLYEKYFHKKKDGRGGAIYLNPAAGCVDSTIENVVINDCEISWNNAYDGYAMYVEDDDIGKRFTIIKNNFNENYNPKNYDNDPNIIYGALITTEINTITKDTIRPPGNTENYNYFAYSNTNLKVNEISYVDHSGRTITKNLQHLIISQQNLFLFH